MANLAIKPHIAERFPDHIPCGLCLARCPTYSELGNEGCVGAGVGGALFDFIQRIPAVTNGHVIRLLRDELEIAMALCGCRTLADITPRLLAGRA